MHFLKIIFVLWFCFGLAVSAQAEETQQGLWTDYSGATEADVTRDDDGNVIIHKDLKLRIEKDRKVVKVGNNVLRPQDRYEYVDDRLTRAEARIGGLEAQMQDLKEQINKLKEEQKKSTSNDENSIVYA